MTPTPGCEDDGILRQFQLACLSLFSYLVADEHSGRAVVVDPQRDVSLYLADAEALGLTIERVVETHLHADFLSGHLELARETGAVISYGPGATVDFPVEHLADGQRLTLGDLELEVRHTPGHTPESICLIVHEDGRPRYALTGDTLFVGDVGRPDLLSAAGFTADDLARRLYHSVHEQLLTLPDDVEVYPAHGAGSACGKSMSDAVSSTIGEQRRTNYALQPMTEDDFVELVTAGQSVAPLYFSYTADANRHDHASLDAHAPRALTIDEVLDANAAVLDCRSPETFASGHLRGAINVGIDGRFAEYAGDVIRAHQPIVLVTDPGRETEARTRLGRIGFDDVLGALPDIELALTANPDLAATAPRLAATDIATLGPEVQLVDVRNPGEQADGMVPGAIAIPLAQLLDRNRELDPTRPTVVYCAGGYRSSTGASLLRSVGFTQVADLQGGYAAWAALAQAGPAPGSSR